MNSPVEKPKRLTLLLIVPLLLLGLVFLNLSKMQLSTQVHSTAQRLEESQLLADELGAPVHVRSFRTEEMKRYTLKHSNTEVIYLRTRVEGSKKWAKLELTVTNRNDQGWAGKYEVSTSAAPVLQGDTYVSETPRVIVVGKYERDGTAKPAAAPSH